MLYYKLVIIFVGVKIKRDMKELAEKIAVMQHFENGGEVECVNLGENDWDKDHAPFWNWLKLDYRIKEEPKEYEILSFNNNTGFTTLRPNKRYVLDTISDNELPMLNVTNDGMGATLEDMLNDKDFKNYKIYLIKRLSDNEIFAIGDKVKQSNVIHDNTFTIIGFELDVNKKHLLVLGNGGIRLSKIEKVKELLFKTIDNVDIFESDEYYQITSNYEIHKCTAFDKSNFDNKIIVFFNKSNAENHVLMNKPCLSIKEICPIIGQCNNNTYIDLDKLTGKLKVLAESKL